MEAAKEWFDGWGIFEELALGNIEILRNPRCNQESPAWKTSKAIVAAYLKLKALKDREGDDRHGSSGEYMLPACPVSSTETVKTSSA